MIKSDIHDSCFMAIQSIPLNGKRLLVSPFARYTFVAWRGFSVKDITNQ